MSLRKRFGVFPVVFTSLAACAIQLSAQPAATCTVAPGGVTALSIERTLTLSNLLTTLTPNVPASVLAGITSGAQEIRSRLIYNPAANTLTDTTFLVAPGSPSPTPIGLDVTGSTIQGYQLSVDRVYTSCAPKPSVLFVGTITGPAAGPFGVLTGAPAAVSVGYTTDTPPKINNVVELIAGEIVAFSSGANGTLTFPAVTVTPPGTASAAPTLVFGPGVNTTGPNQVFFNPFHLDVSGTTDPAKLPVTFMFTSDRAVDFKPGPTSPTPDLYFDAGPGDYTITVTATNSAGLASSQQILIQYTGK